MRKPIFDTIRAQRGKGFTAEEVEAIDELLDQLEVPRDDAASSPPDSAPATLGEIGLDHPSVNENQLARIMPNLGSVKRSQYLRHLQRAMKEFEINTPLRAAAFLAQLAHESGEFRWMEEIWGPTAAQQRYEPVTSLSRNLGNTHPGDGKRFKGRGPIQLTGRSNYRRYGAELGVDLEENPLQAATPEVGFRIACLFWKKNGLNGLADRQMFKTITKIINGGYNGLAERTQYYVRAKGVLLGGSRGINDDNDFTPDPATDEPDFALEDTGDNTESRAPVFTRGSESVREDDGEQ